MRYTLSPIVGRLLWPAWLRLIFAPAACPAPAHMVHHAAPARVMQAIERARAV